MGAPSFQPFQDPDDDNQESSPMMIPPASSHIDSEGVWLISYSDMMTLLMGFFALLLSFSKFDAESFEKVRQETTKVFGGQFQKPFEDLSQALQKVIEQRGLAQQVQIESNPKGVTITFRGAFFFDSGSIDLRHEAQSVMDQLIPVIREQAEGFYILIEGHTDNVPMMAPGIASNWELSGLRAGTVLHLFEKAGFSTDHLMMVGWGQTHPIAPNQDTQGKEMPENQAKNRRVVIKIMREKWDF